MFVLAQHHHYSITEIENMIVFERDIFMQMLADHIKRQEEMYKHGG
jgi:hypothetical protein